MRRSVIAKKTKSIKDPSKKITSTNPNKVADYLWTQDVVTAIGLNTDTCGSFPLFFVIGSCPNSLIKMQAIMFAYRGNKVDYWWIKPSKNDAEQIERATLTYNTSGPWKNDPGKSKSVYDPVMQLFQQELRHENISFHIIHDVRPRACIYVHGENDIIKERLFTYVIWQEDWTVNPFSRSKFLKGKVVFKRAPTDCIFFAREFLLKDNLFKLIGEDTDEFLDIFRDGQNEVKDLYQK